MNNHIFSLGHHHGASTLCAGQTPIFPMFFWQSTVEPRDAQAFSAAGIDLFSFFRSQPHYDHPYWLENGQFDYSAIDTGIRDVLQYAPDAYCLPRIYVSAPEWWIDRYPEEACRYANGADWHDNGWQGTKHESFASARWLREMGEAFRCVVRHILTAEYADRIIGIHVANGVTGEWHMWSPEDHPDTSEPMRQAFIAGLREQYGNDVLQLQHAWQQLEIDFASVTVPTLEERQHCDLGGFRDPAVSRRVIDYDRCHHRVTVQAIDHFCRIVKEESAGRLLTCVFYGYTPDINWPQEGDHRAAARMHRLESVDLVSSPHTYERRKLGGDGYFRNYLGSLALHGKLFIEEADDRTYLNTGWQSSDPTTHDESLAVLRREFANVITHNIGMWYMDLNGGWFHDQGFMEEIGKLKKWADRSMTLPRTRTAKVAVISSQESAFYLGERGTEKNHVGYSLYIDQIRELCQTGAPFDWYVIEDISAERLQDYDAYVFLDCAYISDEQYACIERLKKQQKLLIWCYAAGFGNDTCLSLSRMEKLTGFDFTMQQSGVLEARMASSDEIFGVAKTQSPVFVPQQDEGVEVLAHYTDSAAPAVTCKRFADWVSVYAGVPGVPQQMLRRIFAAAGIHIYCDSGDNITASTSWFAIHTTHEGTKTIRLPEASRVTDIINETLVGENLTEFTVNLPAHATAIFLLGKS
ncbi:MAG TPA: beta-galactosidase [Armatimonadota bacterium]|nr:beta-galactosidase [Armatimonadota bacterium]